MDILENYNLKYNFGENYQSRVSNLLNEMLNGSNDLFAKQLQNGQIGNVKSEYVEMLSFIKNVEEYLYYYKDNPNFNNILNSVSSIKKISVLPVNSRGIYGQAFAEENTLLISPVLGASSTLTHEERTRLYVAHELGHIVNHSWQNTVEKFLNSRVNEGEMTLEEKELYQEGFNMLDESITQNNAENFAYAFAGKSRPNKQYRSSNAGIFGNTPYLSNYDFYGEYQMPAVKFAKTLRGIGRYDNDDIALNMLGQRAMSPFFALDIMDEYDKDNQYENLLNLLTNMGIIKKAGYAAFGYDDRAYIQDSQRALNDFNNLADRMREYRDIEGTINTSGMPSGQTVDETLANRAMNYQNRLNSFQTTPQEISALTSRTIAQNPGFLSRSIAKVKDVIKKIKNLFDKER